MYVMQVGTLVGVSLFTGRVATAGSRDRQLPIEIQANCS